MKLIETSNRKNVITAKAELDVQRGKNIKREILTVEDGDDLEELTNRTIYENMSIGEINVRDDTMQVKGPQLDKTLRVGEAVGSVSGDAQKRLMIQRTIKEHQAELLGLGREHLVAEIRVGGRCRVHSL